MRLSRQIIWWTRQDLNLGPLACEPRDLTYSEGQYEGGVGTAGCLFGAVTG